MYAGFLWELGLVTVSAYQAPVVPELYRELKQYKDRPIPCPENFDATAKIGESKKFLEDIYIKYAEYSAEELSALTHIKATPCDVVYHDETKNNVINDHLLKTDFNELEALLLSRKDIDQIKAAKILAKDSSLTETMYILSHPEDAKKLEEAMKRSTLDETVKIDWKSDCI